MLNRKEASKENSGSIAQSEQALQKASEFADCVMATIREPLLVLNVGLRIIWANHSFYQLFSAKPLETEGKLIYEVANGQWNIPELRKLLLEIISNHTCINDFQVEHDIPQIGRRTLILNAQLIHSGESSSNRILLAIEDITGRKREEQEKASSELRYRRLFETAQDGILILNAETGQITDVNPFLVDMLGYTKEEFLGKRLWELGSFIDVRRSREAYKELQKVGYIRYEDLPLETKNGQRMEVEFVSNTYLVDAERVIQCNVRDISERKQLERHLEFSATHDFLTGLPNRTLLNDHYLLAVAGAKRHHAKLGIMVLDIDHFKDINDSLGHPIGDQLLKEFSSRLSVMVRKTDTVSRIGGDEFALLLTELTESRNIASIAEKIIETARKPFCFNNHQLMITVSLGTSNYPDDGDDIETLVKHADIAMYQAKSAGRNRYLLYEPMMNPQV